MPKSSSIDVPGTVELLHETLLSISSACAEFPVRISRTSIERMIRKGVRGVRLETLLVGHKRLTSREAIRRFLTLTQGEPPPPFRPGKQAGSQKKTEELRNRYGLPESGYTPPH